ncbi:hypothetical protein [Paenibacillus medicaginis]|uniref:TerY-C metal binding domain-containing protein n=1 Tax=Paenibacillus medicaginis TaxID=1470560 RepID=A0ABV5C0J9_9BACL
MSTEKKMYRVLAQSNGITVTLSMNKPDTWDQAESDAKKYIPPETKPYVIQEICDEDDWYAGTLNFCPRCGSKANYDNNGEFECNDCESSGEAYIHELGGEQP